MTRTLLPVLLSVVLPVTASAAPPAASAVISVPVGRLAPESEAPTIDGRVDEAIWQTVEPQSGFVQQDPDEGAPATEKTEVRLLVGRGHVYVGIICFDSDPSRIIVSQARRDASLTDTDAIILVFDTFNDSQNGFVFGTNPLGIEYDGQVASEGQTGGLSFRSGQGGSQRGGISAFNPNWDGDWTVRAAITERGWEAELAIPLKTLRYETGPDRTWGFNVMRNIRRKNEQVYLSPIPRGFDIYRVSLAAKLTGLELPARRDIKIIPYALASVNKDYLLPSNQTDRDGAVGVDLKWGVKPNLTLDVTVNTDFAQVEADEEQVNLTRFDLFFPEKRPFFLENASTFQLGQPQQIDLFFSRRIGLSGTGASGQPIDIIAGSRLSGKLGPWNVGMLDIQTDVAKDLAGRLIAPANNFATVRLQREVGRSNFGGIFVNRQATGKHAGGDNWNRAYGLDANLQITSNSRVFAFLAGTTSPDTPATQVAGTTGTDYSGRIFYDFRNDLWQVSGGYAQVGERFNPEVGFLPRRGYRRPEFRLFYQPQPKRWPWIRRISPHFNYNAYHDLDGDLQSSMAHIHFFEIQPARGGRFGTFVDVNRDNPLAPFPVYNTGGRRVVIPAGNYTWKQLANEYIHDPSAVISGQIRHRVGGFYDGDYNAIELQGNVRVGSRFIGSAGWTRQNVDLSYGKFSTDLVPVRASYSFTTLASLSALLQYNSQSSQMSSNIRLALLNRSGTGLFVVYNDRRDTTRFTPYETVGRSFIVKYTRLVDF